MHNKSHSQLGFTLLEILIALFIFTIISVIMVSTLHTVLNSQSATEKQSARLTDLETALILISRDLEQTINRPITSSKDTVDSFIGTPTSVTFTHAGLANPLGELQRSTLQRAQYSLEKNQLIRTTWPVLEQTAKTTPDQRVLLDHIEDLRFDYLDDKGQFQNKWPPPENQENTPPRAVRMTLTIKQWGKLTQLYIIPIQLSPVKTVKQPTPPKDTMT